MPVQRGCRVLLLGQQRFTGHLASRTVGFDAGRHVGAQVGLEKGIQGRETPASVRCHGLFAPVPHSPARPPAEPIDWREKVLS